MTRTYKQHRIERNANGKWIVTTPDGRHSQHETLTAAKEWISFTTDGDAQGDE